jgi:hypothetical protein
MHRTITLEGAYIRHIDVRFSETESFARVDMTSRLTQALADEFKCPEAMGESYKEMKLDIKKIPLTGFHLVVPTLEKHAIEIEANKLKELKAHRVKDGGALIRELRFQVFIPGEQVETVRQYRKDIGEGEGVLTLQTQAAESEDDRQMSIDDQ